MFWPVYMINWFSFMQHHKTLVQTAKHMAECSTSSNTARWLKANKQCDSSGSTEGKFQLIDGMFCQTV